MCCSHRESGESGQDTVSLSMSMSELDDSGDGKTKKKRGRPGRPPVRLSNLLTRLTTSIHLRVICGSTLHLHSPRCCRHPTRSPGNRHRKKGRQGARVDGRPMGWPSTTEREILSLFLKLSNRGRVQCRYVIDKYLTYFHVTFNTFNRYYCQILLNHL